MKPIFTSHVQNENIIQSAVAICFEWMNEWNSEGLFIQKAKHSLKSAKPENFL